jgi:hypothetical protein
MEFIAWLFVLYVVTWYLSTRKSRWDGAPPTPMHRWVAPVEGYYSTTTDYSNPTGHYVYLHSIDDRVFYVGKGSTNRAWSTSSRNRYWWRWVNHHKPNNSIIENSELCRDNTDITVDIVADNLYPHQAYMLEEDVINTYGVDNLTNILSSNAPAGERQYSKQPRLG